MQIISLKKHSRNTDKKLVYPYYLPNFFFSNKICIVSALNKKKLISTIADRFLSERWTKANKSFVIGLKWANKQERKEPTPKEQKSMHLFNVKLKINMLMLVKY